MKKSLFYLFYLFFILFYSVITYQTLERVTEYLNYGKIDTICFYLIKVAVYSIFGVLLDFSKLYNYFENKKNQKWKVDFKKIFMLAIPLLILSFLPELYWFMGVKMSVILKSVITSRFISMFCEIGFGYFLSNSFYK